MKIKEEILMSTLVVIEYEDGNAPFLIRPAEDARFLAVLMPARVQ